MSTNERRFNPQNQHVLVNSTRWEKWNPPELFARLKILAGQVALDLGCGPGFWTLPLADLIGPQGRVWALDVSQEMLNTLAKRNPPGNVSLLQSELPRIKLPTASVDFVWGAFVAHEVEPLEELVAEIWRGLAPGGRVALLDWRPDAAHADGPPRHHRLAPDTIQASLQAAGFTLLPQDWQHDDAYLIGARSG